MAHKKAAGSAKNLRDSQPKYRGVKLFGGQQAVAGNIIIRQNGSQYECGQNTYLAADFTIHALVDGVVVFKKKNFKRFDGRTYLKTVVAVFPASTTSPTVEKTAPKKAEKTVAKKAEKPVAEEVKTEKKSEKAEITLQTEKKAPEKKTPAKKPTTKKAPKSPKEPAEKKASAKTEGAKTEKKAPTKKSAPQKEE